jgi:hypothetical protein
MNNERNADEQFQVIVNRQPSIDEDQHVSHLEQKSSSSSSSMGKDVSSLLLPVSHTHRTVLSARLIVSI